MRFQSPKISLWNRGQASLWVEQGELGAQMQPMGHKACTQDSQRVYDLRTESFRRTEVMRKELAVHKYFVYPLDSGVA